MEYITELIRTRRSVRTFDGRELTKEDVDKLSAFMEKTQNPYNIPVEFRLLDAKEQGLTCPVVSGTNLYVGVKIKRVPHAEEAFGYSVERFVLYAWSLGIGTVWIGGTMGRDAFERAIALGEDEMMPCVSPLGYPAKKMALKESMMRKAVKADSRLPFETLFFDGAFDVPLTTEKAGSLAELLEMVRWAPSAVNKQPWRAVVQGNAVHFYLKRNKGFISDATGDLQKTDLGIALCHFALVAEKCGFELNFSINDPEIATDSNTEYIGSYLLSL
ncbi:MAG: nitroreductase family protein [Lachnospiraceae bacterium]|nr:nitroreductase family protein [Lachnospiraceae bacterium]